MLSMEASFPALPTEILLRIIESVEDEDVQRRTFSSLRATSNAINEKTLYYFGSRYLKLVEIPLYRAGWIKLHQLVASPLANHVEMLRVHADTFVCEDEYELDPRDSDPPSRCSWYLSDWSDEEAITSQMYVDKDAMKYIMQGECNVALSQTLPNLPNLKVLLLEFPEMEHRGFKRDKIHMILARWTFALKSVISAALPVIRCLEEFTMGREGFPARLSVIETMSIFMPRLSKLKRLALNFDVNEHEAMFAECSLHFRNIFNTASKLTHFELGLGWSDSSMSFFKQLNNTLTDTFQRIQLTRLCLHRIRTHAKDIRQFLRKCKQTLQYLLLAYITFLPAENTRFTQRKEDLPFKFISGKLQLKECIVECINEGDYGLRFDPIAGYRCIIIKNEPSDLGEEDWAMIGEGPEQSSIRLSVEEGDDIGVFLRMVENLSHRGPPWSYAEGYYYHQ